MNTKEKEEMLNSQGYEIEQALGGHYRCVHYKRNGTLDEVVWNDSACEDAYIRDNAVEISYSMLFLDL